MIEKTIKGFEGILKRKESKFNLVSTDIEHYKIKKFGESVFGGGSKKLKEVVSKLYEINPENVGIFEGGCSNVNFLVFYSLIEKGDEVLVENPGYQPLYILPEIFGAKIKRFDRKYENNFQLDLKDLSKKITKKTKMIVLTNFYNPGGVKLNEEDLNKLLKLAERKKFYVLCDETYSDPLIKKDIKPIGILSKYGISTYGLSKKYGLSTLRCGIIVANKEIIEKIVKASFTTMAVNSGLLEKEWLKFFRRGIYKLNKRSEKILNKNYNLLKKIIISRNNIGWVRPEQGSSICTLKFKVKDIQNFKKELNKRDILLAVSDEGIVRLGIGSHPKKFKRAIFELRKILDLNL